MTFIMENIETQAARENGIYYTPSELAEYLVRPLIKSSDLSVFDPACGEGALLLAAKKICSELPSRDKKPNFFGCDKILPNGMFKQFKNYQIHNIDFMKFFSPHKFDVILMNPPFVRHHLINYEDRKDYQTAINNIGFLRNTADLWSYFLMKCISHLKEGSSIGAILPWSFLQSDYARDIRVWLLNKFEEIRVLALNDGYFKEAKERILLLWLVKYGQRTKFIKMAFSQSLEKRCKYSSIDNSTWKSQRVVFSTAGSVEDILKRYRHEFGFCRLGDLAKITIGVVTGADKYFIINKTVASSLGVREKNLAPILTTLRDFSGLYLNGYNATKMLLQFPKNCSGRLKKYIMEGETQGYHKRAHAVRRTPWYSVNVGKIADAFFPYRSSNTPYMVLNNSFLQCTNSVHRIIFRNLTTNQRKWVQISLLSHPGQLSLEAFSKIYGTGVLKIEPSSLKNAIVNKGRKKLPRGIYETIEELIAKNERKRASMLATELINSSFKIPDDLSEKTTNVLNELRSRRISRSKSTT
jgi:adenine-specific DNA-methyltransferase